MDFVAELAELQRLGLRVQVQPVQGQGQGQGVVWEVDECRAEVPLAAAMLKAQAGWAEKQTGEDLCVEC